MEHYKHVTISYYQKSKLNNQFCGDSYYFLETDDGFVVVIVDGLGSGESAKASSLAAIEVIKEHPFATGTTLLKHLNLALQGERGAVIGVLKLDYRSQTYTYTSIGNVGLITIDANMNKKRSIPIPGYIGGVSKAMKEVSFPLDREMIFLLFSDGVLARELTEVFFHLEKFEVTDLFSTVFVEPRKDDTTILALKYVF